jgi:hypothetical protein
VALSGPREAPSVLAKRPIEMATTFETGAVYHAGQGLPLARAEALVRSSEKSFLDVARSSLAAFAAELRERGVRAVASAILANAGRPLPPLRSILRSHALAHAAEGELYRRVLARASEACDIPAVLVPAKDHTARVVEVTGLREEQVLSRLAEMGRASGKPWAKDQKDAALAAWVVLAGRS